MDLARLLWTAVAMALTQAVEPALVQFSALVLVAVELAAEVLAPALKFVPVPIWAGACATISPSARYPLSRLAGHWQNPDSFSSSYFCPSPRMRVSSGAWRQEQERAAGR